MTHKKISLTVQSKKPRVSGLLPSGTAKDLLGGQPGFGYRQCAYCSSPPIKDRSIPQGMISHGSCDRCAEKIEEAERLGEPMVKKCPGCVRNIGSWLISCYPCGRESGR